jgi:hypothetical protein
VDDSYEVRRAALRAEAPQRATRAREHATQLIAEFENEQILVMFEAVSMFLYHVWRTTLEPSGLRLEEFLSDIGTSIAMVHESAMTATSSKES